MSKRLTFYPSKRTGFRQFSGSVPGCSPDGMSEVQEVRSLPINRVKLSSPAVSDRPSHGLFPDLPNQDAPGIWPYNRVGSTENADDEAGWTEVVIPGGLPVLGNLGGCVKTTIIYSSSDCGSTAPKIGFDWECFLDACHLDNRTSRSTVISEMSKFSCPTNNEVT